MKAILRRVNDDGQGDWLEFVEGAGEIVAWRPEDVYGALEAVEEALARGSYAAGLVSYEAAGGLDQALETQQAGPAPLVWFGLFRRVRQVNVESFGARATFEAGLWRPTITRAVYEEALGRIGRYIRAGESYQVNYTFLLESDFAGDAAGLCRRLWRAQRGGYGAYLEWKDFAVCSASPELFFRRDGERIVCRPMKGTARRGCTIEADERVRQQLLASKKERAENGMIVDMMRNDLARIAEPGTVALEELYTAERYPSIWQMTSTVTARSGAGLAQTMKALFPCASVTGAPKVRTMEIIKELEASWRGVYTGCVGYATPDGHMQFNVPIRTALVDRQRHRAYYGTGGGIVADSTTDAEYEECRAKAAILAADTHPFELLETLLWERGRWFLLEKHLSRLAATARYFGFELDEKHVRNRLDETAATLKGSARVRLTVNEQGEAMVTYGPTPERPKQPWRVRLAEEPVDRTNPFLYHKTTRREVYEQARAGLEDCDDVILWNEAGEVTESTIGNIAVRQGRFWVTPPVSCALLAGTFRQMLLEAGVLREAVVPIEVLRNSQEFYILNSVRRWVPGRLTTA